MKKVGIFGMLALLVIILAACGGADNGSDTTNDASNGAAAGGEATAPADSATSGGEQVALAVDSTNFQFDQAEYRVKAGSEVTLSFTSSQGMHGLAVNDLDINLKDGESTTFTAEPGEYTMVCSIMCGPGHGDMISKLIVE